MQTRQLGAEHVLIFEPGDQIVGPLTDYLGEHNITTGTLSGVGGLSHAEIKYWNAEKKGYDDRTVAEQVEVISLLGNVALNDGKPYIHAHAVLGTAQFSALAGHLEEGTAYPTLEIFVHALDGTLVRRLDERTQLETIHPEAGGKGA